MSKEKIISAQDIYDTAGSVMRIAADLNVHQRTIERWREFGVPDSYWKQLHELYGITPFELFKLNGKIKGYKIK